MNHTLSLHVTLSNRRQALVALLGSVVLPGCGGGGSGNFAGISSGGTGSFTSGVVVGRGSIIVNGIRYDDSKATVSAAGEISNAAALKLGMVVAVQGSAVTPAATAGDLATATAEQIYFASEWIGPVGTINLDTKSFTVFGKTVYLLASTVFSGGSLAELSQQFVEVYGFLDPLDASLQASRVEVSTSRPARYRLSGVVTDLNPDAKMFKLGTVQIDIDSASEKPAMLQNGVLVRVDLNTSQVNGAWVAIRVVPIDVSAFLEDAGEAEIEGSITEFVSNASFQVNGIPIDASLITAPSGLALGVRVEVKGNVTGGLVRATRVEVEEEEDLDDQEFEFHGLISSLNTTEMTFVVRGYIVKYGSSTLFEPLNLELSNGLDLEVKARIDPDGTLQATKIEAED